MTNLEHEHENEEISTLDEMQGLFVDSLRRNNKKIREDRAIQIAESAELKYKRKVEDLINEIKQLKRDRAAMLDLSPTNADSLVLASDFSADSFVERDFKFGTDLRNLEIKLEIASLRYKELFTRKK